MIGKSFFLFSERECFLKSQEEIFTTWHVVFPTCHVVSADSKDFYGESVAVGDGIKKKSFLQYKDNPFKGRIQVLIKIVLQFPTVLVLED